MVKLLTWLSLKALESKLLAGAAFDVTPNENDFMNQKQDNASVDVKRLIQSDQLSVTTYCFLYKHSNKIWSNGFK